MADTVICPVCGESNPAEMEFCRNCQSRLHPLTGSLQGENAPIQPGQPPTRKVTSELEAVLPQWLREARQQARESAAEAAAKAKEQDSAAPADPGTDLLAGLASQADEDEETPAWLADITGTSTKEKPPEPESKQPKWAELGGGNEPQDSSLPLNEDNQPGKAPQNEPAERDELADWFRQASRLPSDTGGFGLQSRPAGSTPEPVTPEDRTPVAAHKPEEDGLDWLKNLDAGAPPPASPSGESAAPTFDNAPDWTRNPESASRVETPPGDELTPPVRDEVPDWLTRLQAEQQPPEPPASPAAQDWDAPADVPAWLKSFGEPQPEANTSTAPAPEQPVSDQPLPDWLQSLDSPSKQAAPSQPEPIPEESPAEVELPDWISSLGTTQPPAAAEEKPISTPVQPAPEETHGETVLPDWISSLGAAQPTESATAAEESKPASAPDEPIGEQPHKAAELPDWISALSASEPPAPTENQPAFEREEPTTTEPVLPPATTESAFTNDPLAGTDVDAIFASMQTPDWLSAVMPSKPSVPENLPAAAQAADEPITPAELPSWVQAMRPVESAMAASSAGEADASLEERGPLAGLHGVLPAIPGAAAPSSKPKSHSIKLDATEQQQAHAVLLENILAAETSPIPMRSISLLRTQRLLRWVLSLVILVVVGSVIFTGTRGFPLPGGVPNETNQAIQAVDAVPEGAPVLLIFDYQPATVGEMEATGASLLDHLLLLKHPQLALLSTSPTGSALAERFMSTVLASRAYVRDQQYVNLGFLPGGLAGVYTFAQNPSATMPLDADSKPAWQIPTLPPVTRFSDFAAVIVLTDSVESGRVWIEQTSGVRGQSPLVMIASAQAGPMLLPYVDSGQVNGLISGLNGAAGAEQANGGLPGYVRGYWDAYSVGLYTAILLILLGGLLNLWLGFRDRRAQVVA